MTPTQTDQEREARRQKAEIHRDAIITELSFRRDALYINAWFGYPPDRETAKP